MEYPVKPTFLLSLDFELLWGFHDLNEKAFWSKQIEMSDARVRILQLIEQLEGYEISATWALVGHLFLNSCNGHEDYPDSGWLARDPRSSVSEAPLWYAPDIIETLRGSRMFELACHSFTHAIFSKIDSDTANYELDEFIKAARDFGVSPRSIVFPRNEVGHKALLRSHGIISYRSKPKLLFNSRFQQGLDTIIGLSPPTPVLPRVSKWGIVEIPGSMPLGFEHSNFMEILKKVQPRDVWRWKIRMGLDQVIQKGGIFHVWMHPNDFRKRLHKSDLAYLLELVSKYRDRDELQVMTMNEIATTVIKQKNKAVKHLNNQDTHSLGI